MSLNLGWFVTDDRGWYALVNVLPEGFEPSFREVFLHPEEVKETEEKTRIDCLEFDLCEKS